MQIKSRNYLRKKLSNKIEQITLKEKDTKAMWINNDL